MKYIDYLSLFFLFLFTLFTSVSFSQDAGENLSTMSLEELEKKANSLQERGRIRNSLPYVKAAIKRKAAIKTEKEYALALSDLGDLYGKISDFANARVSYVQAIALLKKSVPKEDPDYIQLQSNLQALDMLIEKAKKDGYEGFPSISTTDFPSHKSSNKKSGSQGWIWLLAVELGILVMVVVMVQRYRTQKQNED